MKIKKITVGKITIPLLQPYVSALRRVDAIEDIIVIIETDNGLIGYGSAAPTPAITGDTEESIIAAIVNILAPKILGKNLNEFDHLINFIHDSLEKNTSAKAAIDIALYDLLAKRVNLPLYQFLGGGVAEIKTGMTVGLKAIEEMIEEAKVLVSRGVTHLKIKAGINVEDDVSRIRAIRLAVGDQIELCIDINQGWSVEQAMKAIHEFRQHKLNILIFEQPVKAKNFSELKFIRDNSEELIFADESCFSPKDTVKLISENAVDGIVIKLMKAGGIYAANVIYGIVNNYDMPCMAGCMLESPISLAAMASFAAGKKIQFIDLGTLSRLKHNPIQGGLKLEGATLILPDKPGLGIDSLGEIEILHEIKWIG